jgi:hypothetical protein
MRRLPPVKIPPAKNEPPGGVQDGQSTTNTVLHVAIVVPTIGDWNRLKGKVRIVQPPYWQGQVHVHVLLDNPKHPLQEGDLMVLQAAYELGWGAHGDLIVTAPDAVTLGFEE